MECYWGSTIFAGFGRGVYQQGVEVVDCPGEEQDHCRGFLGFGGANGGEDAFEVVAAHCGHGVAACLGCVEEGGCSVFDHCCGAGWSGVVVGVVLGGIGDGLMFKYPEQYRLEVGIERC